MMVRVFGRSRSFSFSFKRIFERQTTGHSIAHHTETKTSFFGAPKSMEAQRLVSPSNEVPPRKEKPKPPSDIDLMKEKFAKLLLGEDMSGGGKGVSSALALSNAITNLAASVFGETKRLEPMASERKARWRKEVDWLLSVTDHIVELVPSQQQAADGSVMEIMVTKQRSDLLVNILALRKLDAMLLGCLDNFEGEKEFSYIDFKDASEAEKAGQRDLDKWWIPTVRVPPFGMSEKSRKWLQNQRDSVSQVQKAAMAINAQVLSEMAIPESYIESLPKNGRASLGDVIYKCITDEYFDAHTLLSSMDLKSEHKVLDLKNRIEASIVIWKKKMKEKDGKSSWSSSVSMEKRELFEERAETMLLILKHNFPGLPQSTLDISKIEFNKDVGHAILESYSRVLESLAAAIMNRVDDVFYADSSAAKSAAEAAVVAAIAAAEAAQAKGKLSPSSTQSTDGDSVEDKSSGTPSSRTLLDFMGWDLGDEAEKEDDIDGFNDNNEFSKIIMGTKSSPPSESKQISYLEKLEQWGGLRSPTARH